MKSYKKTILLVLSTILTLLPLSMALVWSRLEVIKLGYKVSEALQEQKSLIELNRAASLEAATLKRPLRIEKIARERLGMQTPHPSQVIVLERQK